MLRKSLSAAKDGDSRDHPRDRDPCALSDLIAETVRRNPEITAFHVRPSGADYSSLLESLSTRPACPACPATTPGSTAITWLLTLWMPSRPPPSASLPRSPSLPLSPRRGGTTRQPSGSSSSSIRGSPVRRPCPSTRSPVAQRGNGTATAPGSPCRVRMQPAGYLPSPSPPHRCLSRTRIPCWSCRVTAPLP